MKSQQEAASMKKHTSRLERAATQLHALGKLRQVMKFLLGPVMCKLDVMQILYLVLHWRHITCRVLFERGKIVTQSAIRCKNFQVNTLIMNSRN